jgi:hypothetical protein
MNTPETLTIKAINKKNQVRVNRAVRALISHNKYNDLRDIAEGNDDEKELRKYNRLCEKTFDTFLDHMWYLPKNQQNVIYKSELYFTK